jgi:glycosyltransferase involved in cell wall biosynthesis
MATAKPARVGINLCSIRPGQLSGPSVYAERLTEKLLEFEEFEWLIYCHRGAHIPPMWAERANIRRVVTTLRRPLRVGFEQIVLPILTTRDSIDLLFSPNFVSPLWGADRLVVTIHDMYYRVVPDVPAPWQRRYWGAFIPRSARRCDCILAVSRATARDIASYLPDVAHKTRVTSLASAVEDKDAPGERVAGVEPGFVLWVANVVRSKNPQAVTAAARVLAEKGRPLRFVHVGSDENGLLDAAIAADNCSSHFRRLGRVSAAELRWLYRSAVCVVQPSTYEGFGLPVLEAQAFGAPLVCSNAGALPEVAGDGAMYFAPGHHLEFADLILRIAEDPALRLSLSARGLENAARFSWSKTASETIDVFRRLFRADAAGKRQ